MSAKSIITTVTGFLAHHIADLNNVSDVLAELVSAVPLDSQDKDRIHAAIETIRGSANNINDFLEGTTVKAADVTIKESDIVEAIGNFFASDEGKAALAEAAKSAEGNANA